MNTQELKDRYSTLYAEMAASCNPKNMEVFGHVMTEMMDWLIRNRPAEAEMFIEELCSVMWENYLTRKEAQEITAAMQPASWSYEAWKQAVVRLSLPMEEEYCYNEYALYAVMCMVDSDSRETLRKLLSVEVTDDRYLKAAYALALDKLCDADKRFNVRSYFGL